MTIETLDNDSPSESTDGEFHGMKSAKPAPAPPDPPELVLERAAKPAPPAPAHSMPPKTASTSPKPPKSKGDD